MKQSMPEVLINVILAQLSECCQDLSEAVVRTIIGQPLLRASMINIHKVGAEPLRALVRLPLEIESALRLDPSSQHE